MYRPDPAMLEQPLTSDDIADLLSRRGQDLSKSRNAEHLLQRMAATMRFYNDRLAVLNRDVDNMRVQLGSQPGRSSTLDPLAAAKFLSPQDRAKLFNSTAQAYIAQIEQLSKDLLAARREMLRVTNTVRTVLVGLDEDPGVPAEVKQHIIQAARRLPTPQDVTQAASAADAPLRRAELIVDPFTAAQPPPPPGPRVNNQNHPTTTPPGGM